MKLTDDDFKRIVTFVKDNYGINLIQKRLLIEGRLSFTIQEKGYTDFKEYIDAVFSDKTGEEMTLFMNKLTTNHTYFMRENEHFEFLKSTVLPQLERTVKDRDIRIWSAGCSYGNEPYNLAMCIDEYFGENKKLWDCKILATDISQKALLTAKNGVYKDSDLQDIPQEWLKKYFDKLDEHNYQVKKALRDEVVFKYFNLMDEVVYKKPFDLILCRNVMIYFDSITREGLVNRFYDATKDGGYLFIGHAENISKKTNYKLVKPAIYIK